MKNSNIGGQAVLEGVMMRGKTAVAIAVRDESGEIRLDTKREKIKLKGVRKIPFIRGVFNFFDSMVLGVKTITKAAEVIGEDTEISSKDSEKGMKWLMAFSVFLGLALSIVLFIFLPNILTGLILKVLPIENNILKNLVEGGFRIIIFIGYLLLVSSMKEIRRTFMYHGAEHKTINCFEHDLELTVENVQSCSTRHDRCGTSFLFFVMIISILLFSLTGWTENVWIRLLIRLALLPIIAGISYELLKLLANHKAYILFPFRWLGRGMQKLTTRQPTDAMVEVSITAFKAVLQMDMDETVSEVHFPKTKTLGEFKTEVNQRLTANNIDDLAMTDWVFCDVFNLKRNELKNDFKINFLLQNRVNKIVDRLILNEPLQYVLGYTEFYGYKFFTDKNVLIPRPETELLVEQAIKLCNENTKVLDMCCGSGCIGISINLNIKANVTCVDIDKNAVSLTAKNASNLASNINVLESDLFCNVNGKFDIIVSNPPYIKTEEIEKLDENVKKFEPHLALDGGTDGLNYYTKIIEESLNFLNENGKLVFEIGYDQKEDILKLLNQNFKDIQVIKDYNGLDRIIIATINN